MAPATNIGAAHPVAVGGGGDKEMIKKVENDAAAFARTIATERGRNAEWAEKAVRSSVSATEREAVKLKIVDLVAESVPDLLAKIDGRTVKTVRGQITLATRGRVGQDHRGALPRPLPRPDLGSQHRLPADDGGHARHLLRALQPGAILPGVIGGICLILAFYAFQSLPVNWAGLLLLLFGVVLLIAEIKVVSHGVLAIGGVVAMLIGSLMLYDSPETTGIRLSWYVMIPTVGTTAGLVFFAVSMGVRALYRPGDRRIRHGGAARGGAVGPGARGAGDDRRRAVAGGEPGRHRGGG